MLEKVKLVIIPTLGFRTLKNELFVGLYNQPDSLDLLDCLFHGLLTNNQALGHQVHRQPWLPKIMHLQARNRIRGKRDQNMPFHRLLLDETVVLSLLIGLNRDQ